MKYKMKDFAAKHALTLGKHCVYGVFRGYHIHVKYTPIGNPRCLVTVVTDAREKQKQLEKYLDSNRQKLHISNFGVVKIGLMVCPRFTGEVFARVETLLEEICAHLKKAGFAGAEVCPYCGQSLEGGGILATESDIPFRVHEKCFMGALASARQKDAQNAAKPDKKALGALGGTLGALFGGVLFVLTYAWWGFGALGAAAGVLLAYFLYRKFGGKASAFAVAYCGAAALLLSLAGYVFGLYMDAHAAGGGWSELFSAALADGGGRALFIVNLVLTVAFAGVGTVYNACSYRKDRRTIADKMRRLDG